MADIPSSNIRRSSFYWALKCLPVRKRRAIFAVYAFCRVVDDIADGALGEADKMRFLDRYAQAIDAVFSGGDTDLDTVQTLRPHINHFGLVKADFMAVVAGMRMDAVACVRIVDRDAFHVYLDRVACAVGRLSNAVFGVRGPQADALAHHLGRALQITNILRDLREDAMRGRLYVPQDLLCEVAVDGDALPDQVLVHPKLEAALVCLAEEAEGDYAAATVALGAFDSSAVRPARMMMAVYRRVLAKLKTRGLTCVDVPVRLGWAETLWIAFRYAII